MKREPRRQIPSVDALLRDLGDIDIPRAALIALIRKTLGDIRRSRERLDSTEIVDHVRASIDTLRRAKIQPLINATGILIHTNLGRAPLGDAVIETLRSVGDNYNNLEFDLTDGTRGGRAAYLEHNLAVLCGAQAATVVNNGTAALVLILRHFVSTARPEVVISRGELIQIGGGFRIPEILEASGATLHEIGTTNKTTLADYSRAVGKQTALILKVHRSNFFMDGFVESPDPAQIAQIARKQKIPFVEDLGSGAVFPTETQAALEHEPAPQESLSRGVDLVCFSGDKLLGGPQAGIIAGGAKYVAALKRNPFFRALRCDKLILSALQTTVDLHLSQPDTSSIPILEMLRMPLDAMTERAQVMLAQLRDLPLYLSIGTGQSQIGGGTLPRSKLPSVTLDLLPRKLWVNELAGRLRSGTPPVIGYISGKRLKLDLRTVFPRQDAQLVSALRAALA